jgi:hypothetical protein
MSNFLLRPVQTAALLVCASASMTVLAGDPVTDAMQAAYAPYRVALFKTNGNSQAESLQATVQAQQAWTALATQFGAKPPAPYDRDRLFAASLAKVSAVYAKAAEQISANQLTPAHETLEQARDTMAELRHRNQVVVYSDHMNAYHAQMEAMLKSGIKVLGQPQGLQQLTAQAGVLAYLAKMLTAEAPVAYSTNKEFVASIMAVDKSVNDLLVALYAQDAQSAKLAIEKVKEPYSRLFLKFG